LRKYLLNPECLNQKDDKDIGSLSNGSDREGTTTTA
jgi:hypothetical protein